MIFEIGKYYEHNTGLRMHIVAEAELHFYGPGLIAETDYGSLMSVGKTEDYTVNWHEITREEWVSSYEEIIQKLSEPIGYLITADGIRAAMSFTDNKAGIDI